MTSTPNAERGAAGAPSPADRFFAHIERSGSLPPNVTAMAAASAVLCVLSERISGGEAADLRESMPAELRTVFQPCPRDRQELAEDFDRQEFLRRVAGRLGITPLQAEVVARTVFEALHEEVPGTRGEIDDVESQLPSDLKGLWRAGVP